MRDFAFQCNEEDAARGRLDLAVLARAAGSNRALVSACFARGGVQVDGCPAKKNARPVPGQRVSVAGLEETSDRSVAPEPEAPLSVAYEDRSLLVLDKPAGQPCHPLSAGEGGTLAAALVARFPETAAVGLDPLQPGILHRLDAGTSGLVLAARTPEAFRSVRAQFSDHSARKVYHALVCGRVAAAGGVSGHLAHASSFRGRMRVVSGAALPKGERPMFAETFYKPLRDFSNGTTLLEVTILTGVTHQIRCQLASIGHPIVGDTLYGAPTALPPSPWGPWHRLRAVSVTLIHPDTGKECTLRVPAWQDL